MLPQGPPTPRPDADIHIRNSNTPSIKSALVNHMGQDAPRVCTDASGIKRLVALTARLPAHAHVRVHMHDGSACEGLVRVRASAQAFLDPQHREGMNARVGLEDPVARGRIKYVWLDQVARVEHLDSGLGGEN
jgi:hypothetical protein